MIATELLRRLETLCAVARPINDDDWGTRRQVDAQNAFFSAFGRAGLQSEAFDDYCMKATVDEMLDEAMRIARGG